jgi:hypothetical protein
MTAVAGDFTGDGRTDVIAGDFRNPRIVLYVAPDWKAHQISDRANPIHSAVYDVDGDGDLDYLGARFTPGLVFWLERPTDPTAGAWTLRAIDDSETGGTDGVHGILAADVDGAGGLDLIAGSQSGAIANSIVWYARPADPRSAASWPRFIVAAGDATGANHYVGFGDVDKDGRGDIAIGAKIGNYFAWWKQPDNPRASGAPAWARQVLSGPQAGATNILVADVDDDGHADFIASRGHGTGLLWYKGPTFTAQPIDATLVGPHSLAIGDVDRDGDVDVASAAFESKEAAWFENDGRGVFTKRSIGTDQSAYDVRLVDMDADQDLDLLVAGHQSGNVVYYEAHP